MHLSTWRAVWRRRFNLVMCLKASSHAPDGGCASECILALGVTPRIPLLTKMESACFLSSTSFLRKKPNKYFKWFQFYFSALVAANECYMTVDVKNISCRAQDTFSEKIFSAGVTTKTTVQKCSSGNRMRGSYFVPVSAASFGSRRSSHPSEGSGELPETPRLLSGTQTQV